MIGGEPALPSGRTFARAGRFSPSTTSPAFPPSWATTTFALPETREAQAALAQSHGIEGFCYWHYWFAGRRLLERPFNAVLESGKPDFPFCLAWANHSWTAAWVGRPWELLVDQTYPGRADYEAHFRARAGRLRRRSLHHGRREAAISGVSPGQARQPARICRLLAGARAQSWLQGSVSRGCIERRRRCTALGLDGGVHKGLGNLLTFLPSRFQQKAEVRRRAQVLLERPSLVHLHQAIARSQRPSWLGPLDGLHDGISEGLLLPSVCSYRELVDAEYRGLRVGRDEFPCVIPNWDNTPRVGRWGWVLHESSPELFAGHLRHALSLIADRPFDKRLVFIKSWNEWAEGNHLEPDERYGRGYLEAARRELVPNVELPMREMGS